VIDKVFPLADVADAHRLMETNANFGKIILNI
jgi:NADPH:quinone reductase-like Zn-dependent oxidoreductase